MAEYIERESAIQFVNQNTCHFNGETTLRCVELCLKEVPAADVVEVVHGEWIQGNATSQECSCCGFEIDDDVSFEMYFSCYTKPKFCPECGAKWMERRIDNARP